VDGDGSARTTGVTESDIEPKNMYCEPDEWGARVKRSWSDGEKEY
jgi:hypothetical protein